MAKQDYYETLGVERGARRGADADGMVDVLHADRDPMQGAAGSACREFGVGLPGVGKRLLGGARDEGADLRLEFVGSEQPARANRPARQIRAVQAFRIIDVSYNLRYMMWASTRPCSG